METSLLEQAAPRAWLRGVLGCAVGGVAALCFAENSLVKIHLTRPLASLGSASAASHPWQASLLRGAGSGNLMR